MSVLADKIEKFILHKLLEEEEENIVLRRNELADELECAPSQISYVLSTRFSNDRGFIVESRRGSGGFVRIMLHQTFKSLFEEIDDEAQRMAVITRILKSLELVPKG